MDLEEIKKNAGYLAASFVKEGMVVGLGTGSTAKYFIEKLIERKKTENLNIQTISSSLTSLNQAKQGNLNILDINQVDVIDLTVDGADEIDSKKRMIKGGGGALLREKIVASMSREMIVIIDESKQVKLLGSKKLPIEVVPFACMTILRKIQKRGLFAQFRTKDKNSKEFYVTDNGNYIIDIHFNTLLENPEKEHALLKEIPGVVETGFFFHLAGRVIVALSNGQIITIP